MLSLFFVSLGIRLDLSLLAAQPATILATALGLLVLKTAVVFGSGLLMGLNRRAAIEAALILAAGGEFAFVLLDNAMSAQVVPPAIGRSVRNCEPSGFSGMVPKPVYCPSVIGFHSMSLTLMTCSKSRGTSLPVST